MIFFPGVFQVFQVFQVWCEPWLKGTKISLSVKLKLYEALVTSVLLYNCNSWVSTAKNMKKLDVCQRKHLRQILHMQDIEF